MKITKILAGAILMTIFTMMNTASVFADTTGVHGHIDSIVENAVAGWMWDSQSPDAAQEVTVSVINKATGETAAVQTVNAEEYREDLKAKGLGTGNYGFHVEIVWEDLPEAVYTVMASACGKTLTQTLTHSTETVQAASASGNTVYLGNYLTTAYCPCRKCSEGWGRKTSSGALATSSHTVAVDPRVIPMGSRLLIDGKEYVAEDVGGAVKGKHIDIYFDSHGETLRHGTRRAEVYLIQ